MTSLVVVDVSLLLRDFDGRPICIAVHGHNQRS